MLKVPLTSVPNQSISFNADGVLWTVHVYQTISFMCVDISRSVLSTDASGTTSPVALTNGTRCFGGIQLLQYDWQTTPNLGNFIFDSDADWTEFGASCNLYYLEDDEVTEFLDALSSGVI